MFLLFLFCTTKLGEISDIAKCFENFVSQTLGFLTSFYAAELRLYKNIIDRDTVNVHSDYRVYATEFINFLSVIITTRVKNEIVKKELNKKYSYKQIFRMLSKYMAKTEHVHPLGAV